MSLLPHGLDSRQARDGLLAVVFAVVALIPALGQYGLILGDLPVREGGMLRVVLIVAQTLPLAVRRTAPVLCLGVVGVAFALYQCLAFAPSPAGLGVLFALYSVGAYQRRRRTLVAVASLGAYAGVAIILRVLGSPDRPWELATFGLVLAAAWGAGDLVRVRGAAASSRAELRARTAVLDERARLARELHDVVSHHVTGMVVQADAAVFLLPDEAQAVRGELSTIAETGRHALTDLRRLLDVLGSDGSSARPAMGSLADLVAEARHSGQRVELNEQGVPRGSAELRLAVYRLTQEGLTNARKHAPGAAVQVSVDWVPADVRVQVHTAAPSDTRPRTSLPGSGRGLAGLHDRVARLGGHLRAEPTPTGGFVLEASLPQDPGPRRGDETDG